MYTSSTISECAKITKLKEIKETKNKNYIVFLFRDTFFWINFHNQRKNPKLKFAAGVFVQ